MLQIKNEEIQKIINNNINSNNENLDTKINNKNCNVISVSESQEKSKNKDDEIIDNLLSNINKNDDLQFKINQSSENNSFENVRQDIINFYLIEKQKYEEKKKEIETNKTNKTHNYKIKNNYTTNHNRTRPHSAFRKANKNKNHFEKYDKEKISYEIYHQYQKLNFNFLSIPFIQRMELYSLKKCLKDYKVEELTNLKSPKISEKEIVQTFNRLIEDSNRRLCRSKNIMSQEELNEIKVNNKNNDKKNLKKKESKKSFSKKKWDEIYEKRFVSKEKERNSRLEEKRKEKEEKIKEEEDNIINNLNKKEESFNKRYCVKRNNSENNLMKYSTNSLNNNKYYIGNSKIVTNLNQRLYYNEIKKKDIYYKSFLEKAYELLDDNVNLYNNKNTKKNKKKNYFRKKINAEMKKDNQKKDVIYNFIDFDEKDENKEEEKNNNNFNKIIKELKDNIDTRISEISNINNSKIEISGSVNYNSNHKGSAEKIIDRFFEN